MASTYLTRTPSSAGNRRTWTWSCWVKRSNVNVSDSQNLLGSGTSGTASTFNTIRFNNNKIQFFTQDALSALLETAAVYRDPSAWYHVVVAVDTTQATSTDRVKIYVNGEEQSISGTYPTLNEDTSINNNIPQGIGARQVTGALTNYFDGYMTHAHFTDGTAYDASSFGETDTNGQWKPKTAPSVTYGTNGFFLKFADSGSLGTDSSGNGNNWTKNGSGDQVTDTPDNVFSSILPMANTSLSNGNLKLTTSRTGYWDGTVGTIGAKSGKWYWEIVPTYSSATFRCVMGVIGNEASQTVVLNGKGVTTDPSGTLFDNYAKTTWTTYYYKDGSTDGTTTVPNSGDIINVAVDLDNNKIYFGINNTYYANDGGTDGDPSSNLNESMSGLDSTVSEYMPFFQIRSDSSIGDNIMIANFGQDSSFSGAKTAQNNADENGYGDFYYTPPTGFLALCTKNLSSELTLPIGDGSQYFNTVLYTGNHPTGQSITGVGFQPDWVWGKCRSHAQASRLFDSTRGALNNLISSGTNAEQSLAGSLTSFDSDGFTLGSDDSINYNGRTFVAWNWKANGGTTSSNTDGSITSTVQANTTAGFSIVTYTGTGANATIGHGLGVAPKIVIIKSRTNAYPWVVLETVTGSLGYLFLNTTAARATTYNANYFNNSVPTSSVVNLGDDGYTNNSNMIAYCFAEIEGYSSFGKYTGNGSADGPFIYTGFRPAWVMVKNTTTATSNWEIHDAVRGPINTIGNPLFADSTATEYSNRNVDFLSNGFKQRNTNTNTNGNGHTLIFMAFAENPFVDSTGRPVTAR